MKFHLKQAEISHVSHCLQLKQLSSWCIVSGYIWSFAVSSFFSSSLSIPPFNQKKSSYKIPYLRSMQKHWEEWSNSAVCFILSWFSSSEAQASLVAQMVKSEILSAIQETKVRSLGQENPLKKGMAAHSSILAWEIPWTEEPDRL